MPLGDYEHSRGSIQGRSKFRKTVSYLSALLGVNIVVVVLMELN